MRILLTFAVAAVLMNPVLAVAQAPKKAAAAVQTEFDGFITKFRAALKANDLAAVAGMTKLPFMGEKAYGDAAQFGAKAYPEFFTSKSRGCIGRTKAVYDRDGENNDTFHVICGESIFTFTRTPAGFLFTDVGMND